MWELWFSAKAICYKINACIMHMYVLYTYIHICKNQLRLTLFYVFVHFVQIEIMMTSAIILSRFALLANRYSPGKGSQVISYFRFSAFFGNAYFPRGIRAGVLWKSINLAGWYSIFPVTFSSVQNIHHESYHIKAILNENLWICKKKHCSVWYQNFNVNNWEFGQQFFFRGFFF